MATITTSAPQQDESTPGTMADANVQPAGMENPRFWHRTAPEDVVKRYAQDVEAGWQSWQQHLLTRATPPLPRPLTKKGSPLLWGLSPALGRAELTNWLADIRTPTAGLDERLGDWLIRGARGDGSVEYGLECLAVAHEMPRLAEVCNDSLWWGLHDFLQLTAAEAQLGTPDSEAEPMPTVSQQLLGGELAFTLAHQLPEIEPLRELRKQARELLTKSVLELLDGEGLPRAPLLPVLQPLFASWTRTRLLTQSLKKGCWSQEAQEQYEWLLRHLMRLTRSDGSLTFCADNANDWSADMFAAALELDGDDGDHAAAHAMLPGRTVPADADFDDDDLPAASINSEWAGIAVLSPRWSKAAPRLSIAYATEPFQLELECGRDLLFSGNWSFALKCDGQTVEIDDDEWEEQIWQSDEDCDFLELVIELSHGLRIERQLLLGREDPVLYLADCVLSDHQREHDFELSWQLTLADGGRFEPESESRDGLLIGKKPRAAVFPLALPEWRTDPRVGQLASDGNDLQLTHRCRGRQFCCPLLLDFKPNRITKDRTWRQLAVAERLAVQPHDVVVGYRAQSGKDQWIMYRSLDDAANRTVIGQNLSSEFFAGRFLRTGEVDEFIEIETDDDE